MNLQKIQENKKGISPIIATLLLIVIAIAAGVIVYASVIGFIWNSTTNSGGATSVISVDNACISASGNNCKLSGSNNAYLLVLRNVGTTTLSGTYQIYVTDITTPADGGTTTCVVTSTSPGSSFTCPTSASTSITGVTLPSAGDTVTFKVVATDGGATTYTVKAIA